jgi:hypothetical protein
MATEEREQKKPSWRKRKQLKVLAKSKFISFPFLSLGKHQETAQLSFVWVNPCSKRKSTKTSKPYSRDCFNQITLQISNCSLIIISFFI